MLVCPECKHVQREGTGVCGGCEFRFAPGTDEVTEPRRPPKQRGSMRRVYGLLVAGILIAGLFTVKAAVAPPVASPAQKGVDNLVSRIATTIDQSGTLDPSAQSMMVDAARTESGCGYVDTFIVSADAFGEPTPGVPSAEDQVTAFLKTVYKADVAAATTALNGKVVVGAAGWSCP